MFILSSWCTISIIISSTLLKVTLKFRHLVGVRLGINCVNEIVDIDFHFSDPIFNVKYYLLSPLSIGLETS